MATWQATDVVTGAVEKAKYSLYDTTELYIASLTTALAGNDIVIGPVMPAGTYLTDLIVDVDQLDTGTALKFEVGYSNTSTSAVAAFISNNFNNATGASGGVNIPNVGATYGANFTLDTTVIATITTAAGTAKAGKMRFKLTYNPNA